MDILSPAGTAAGASFPAAVHQSKRLSLRRRFMFRNTVRSTEYRLRFIGRLIDPRTRIRHSQLRRAITRDP